MHRLARPLVALAALSFGACFFPKAGIAPGPLDTGALELARSRWPDATAESMETGRGLFVTKCADCHSHPDINHYAEAKWPGIMEEMGPKSDLSPADAELVLRFILAARSPSAPKQ